MSKPYAETPGGRWRARNLPKVREYNRHYRKSPEQRDKALQRTREWNLANPEKLHLKRRANVLRQYGLTVDDYERMLRAQGGVCALCGGAPDGNLQVDHDHVTGRIRGLLCRGCNGTLGGYEKFKAIEARIEAYLRGQS